MFEAYTPQRLWNQLVSELDTDLSTNEGSFLYDMIGPTLLEIWKVYLSMNALEPMFYVDETSGPYIDKMAGVFGMTRKKGARAVCNVTFSGTAGTIIPAGASFLTADGLSFLLDARVTLTAEGGSGTLTAAEAGAKYNIGAGEIVRSQTSHYGVTSFVNTAAGGGADEETDAALVTRLYATLRKPHTSGNAYHYQQWATEVSGVGAARVIGLWNGPGTVKVVMADADMRPVDETVLENASAYISENRPVGANVTCKAADITAISVSASVSVATGYTVESVKEAFTSALAKYLASLVKDRFPVALNADVDNLDAYRITVGYNKIAALLIGCNGVLDYDGLQVNGATANVILDIDAVPVMGEVTLT